MCVQPLEAIDPRIKVMSMRGFDWDTYQVIEDLGLLDDVPRGLWADDGKLHLFTSRFHHQY